MSHPPGNSHKISGAGPASARPLDRWGAILATGLGLGMFAPAPGTWGAAAGVPLAVAVAMLPWGVQPVVIVCLLLLGVPLCAAGQRWYGRKDPGQVIWDEIASMPIVFLAVPAEKMADWGVLLVGFALHRLFDISKPPPCRQLERLPSGWGIMADDVMAAAYAAVVLHGLLWLGWIG